MAESSFVKTSDGAVPATTVETAVPGTTPAQLTQAVAEGLGLAGRALASKT